MDMVTGTLKYFGPTKDGKKATLTGTFDNEKDKMWCTWEEAKPLRDAKLVYKHPVDTWDDGKPKWMVNGQPQIMLKVEWEGKTPKTEVITEVPAGVASDAVESTPRPAPSSWTNLERVFATAHACAKRFWRKAYEADHESDQDIQAIRATFFIEGMKRGLGPEEQAESSGLEKGSYEEMPAALQEDEADSLDLPF